MRLGILSRPTLYSALNSSPVGIPKYEGLMQAHKGLMIGFKGLMLYHNGLMLSVSPLGRKPFWEHHRHHRHQGASSLSRIIQR